MGGGAWSAGRGLYAAGARERDLLWVHDDEGDPGRRNSAGAWRSVLHVGFHM